MIFLAIIGLFLLLEITIKLADIKEALRRANENKEKELKLKEEELELRRKELEQRK